MSINIAHLARLARLHLTADEQAAGETDLQHIITMIDAMQAVPTDGVEPLAHPVEGPARLREDAVTETVAVTDFQGIAPQTEDGFYLVPQVIE